MVSMRRNSKVLRQQRVLALSRAGRTVELDALSVGPGSRIIRIDLGYNDEFWIVPKGDLDYDQIGLMNGRLILSQEDIPLTSENPLRERGLRAEKIPTRL